MKKLLTESLESKLLKYSLAAGAIILVAKESHAQVIYTNPTDTVGVSRLWIDLDNNGTVDLYLRAGTNNSFVANNAVEVLHGKVLGYNKSSLYHYASALNSGSAIGPGGNFSIAFGLSYLIDNSKGKWVGANKKFLGVKFTGSDGKTHYGWVRLSCTSTQLYKLSVYDYAYQSLPNTAINGGALPVELTTFTANDIGDKVELKWQTATEVNNYGFDIERKQIGNKQYAVGNDIWEKIGFVKGNGNSNSPKNYSFIDENPVSGKVEYRLKQIDNNGIIEYSHVVTVNLLPTKFELIQNYPNPFNPTTTIQYAIPKAEHVTLKVYDELGNEVKTLVDENKAAGQYNVQFSGSGLASGIYYYRITAGNFNEVKKLMLLK